MSSEAQQAPPEQITYANLLFYGSWAAIDRLESNYRACGLNDLTVRAYEGGRHELFNETNRAEVVKDLLQWLDASLP